MSGNSFAATDCRDIEFVFARGSGAARNSTDEWKQFKSAMAKVAKRRGYSYRITDLDYPAVSVSSPINALGAKIGGGKAFAFGRSVSTGVDNLRQKYKDTMKTCPNTKWVLGGYSQGALVAARAVSSFDASKVVYVGLFGDPWTNLPEGKGLLPNACFGRNLSNYRIYAPVCTTNTGSLGAKSPYVPSGLNERYGLWCNKDDYICGSSRSLLKNSGHLKYASKKAFIWMADLVERRLPRKSTNQMLVLAAEVDDEEEVEDTIEAHLSAEEYIVWMDGYVTLDASTSFSMNHEIVEYQWSVDGGEFWSTGSTSKIQRLVVFPNQENITLRVIDDAGRSAETTAKIVAREGDGLDSPITPPRLVTAECVDDEITIKWTDKMNARAKYILIRINDIDLDYVPVGEYEATITDIENYGEIESIKVAWLSYDLEVGEWSELSLNCPEAVNIEPVETGVKAADSALLGLTLVVIVVLFVYKKYLPR